MSSHACREKPSPFRRRSDHTATAIIVVVGEGRECKGECGCTKMPMETAEILHQFERYTGQFARAAVEAAVARREEITPELLRILKGTVDRAAQLDAEGDYMAHLYAMFLLAQFRETRAYPLVVRCVASRRPAGFSLQRLHHGKPRPSPGVGVWRRIGRYSVLNRERGHRPMGSGRGPEQSCDAWWPPNERAGMRS